MTPIYISKDYSPEKVTARYVRSDLNGRFWFCEVAGDRRFDVRQGVVEAGELPQHVLAAAIDREGYYPSYVEWPL